MKTVVVVGKSGDFARCSRIASEYAAVGVELDAADARSQCPRSADIFFLVEMDHAFFAGDKDILVVVGIDVLEAG